LFGDDLRFRAIGSTPRVIPSRSIEASPSTALFVIFDEANSMPSVETRYFHSVPLRGRTSEVKGQS